MPLYQVDVDGQTVEFDSPVDLTPEQLEAEVSGFRSQLAPPAAPEEAPGYLSQLGTSLYQGGRQAIGGARTAFNALTGDTADMAAGLQQQAEAQRALQEAQTPEDVAFLEDLNKQAEELKQARGFLPTLSEAIDLPMAALRQPGAALKTAVQSLPNALISTPITLGAGALGTAAGGLVGLPTTGPGAIATGIAGGIAAGTAANTALEAGSEIYQRFVERIGDPAGMTREQIAAALDQNPDIASEGLTTGLTRGAVIGTIETLGLKGAGALLAAPERAAIQATRQVLTRSGVDLADDAAVRAAMSTPEMAKATKAAADAARAGFNVPARAAGAGAVEIGASGVGEALAQQAVGQETDYADVFLEMLGEGVAAAPSVLAARGVELAGTGIQAVRERVSEQVADNAKADARLDIDDLINNAGENAATQVNQAVDDAAKVVPAGQPADRAAQIKARLAEIEARFGPPDQTTFDAQGNPVITPYRVMTTEESRLRQELAGLEATATAPAQRQAPTTASVPSPAATFVAQQDELAQMEQELQRAQDEGLLADIIAEERQRAIARQDAARRRQDAATAPVPQPVSEPTPITPQSLPTGQSPEGAALGGREDQDEQVEAPIVPEGAVAAVIYDLRSAETGAALDLDEIEMALDNAERRLQKGKPIDWAVDRTWLPNISTASVSALKALLGSIEGIAAMRRRIEELKRQPQATQDEIQIAEAGGLPPVESQPVVQAPAGQAPEGAALGGREGQEGQVALPQELADWDKANRNDRAGEWFTGGHLVNRAFEAAASAGADQLQAHGMAKEATLSGGLRNLLNLLRNGVDPNRGGGQLYTAQLAKRKGQVGVQGATASGTAYRDGPFVLVQNREASQAGLGIRNVNEIAAVLVNEANIDQLDAIRSAIQSVNPNIIVAPYSEVGAVTQQILSQLPAPQAGVVSPEGVTASQPLPPTGGVPTASLPADTQPTSGDVGNALRAVATNTATPEQVASLEAQGLVRIVQGQPVITDAGLAQMPEAERPRLTEAERVAEIQQQTQDERPIERRTAMPAGGEPAQPIPLAALRAVETRIRRALSGEDDASGGGVRWPVSFRGGVAGRSDLPQFTTVPISSIRGMVESLNARLEETDDERVAFSSRIQANGDQVIVINPLNVAKQLLSSGVQESESAEAFGVTFYEELTHLADDANARAEWQALPQESRGAFTTYLRNRDRQITQEILQFIRQSKNPEQAAQVLSSAIANSFNAYNAGVGQVLPPQAALQLLASNERMGSIVQAEFIRQMVQQDLIGTTTELTTLRRFIDRVVAALDRLISYISLTEAGAFGDTMKARLQGTKDTLLSALGQFAPQSVNTPPANIQPSIRPLQGDQQRNETSARRRRGKAQVPASLRDRDGPPLPNIKVSANDGSRAREIEDKQVPGAKDTWIGTAAEYLAEFPDQTAVNDRRVEAFYDPATDRAVILIDRVVARDGDAIRAARNGTSAAVEAVRRLIRHESFVHRGWRALPQNLKTEFLAIAESLVPEEEINAIVAKGYSRYANWSTDPAVRALVVEEWLAQRLETLEKLPATDGGPLSRLIDWAKRVWQWLNGNDAVEPTRAELVDVMRQMIRALEIGEKEVASEPIRPSFIGEKAQMSQFMRDSLETARSMAAAGKSSEEIRAVTGWFPGLYDGKMRWELPDNEVTFTAEADSKSPYLTIGQVIDNPALFEAYPDARNIYFKRTELGPNEGGYFDPIANRIVVNSKKSEDEQLSSALHEIQHWIQGREKFAEGASPDVFYWDSSFKPSPEVQAKLDDINTERVALRQEEVQLEEFFANLTNDQKGFGKNVTESRRLEAISTRRRELSEEERKITKPERNRFALSKYRATAGEIEARDVQARRTMTPEQRRATAPYSSENIAPEDAIVIFDGREQGVMASLTDTDAAYMDALQGDRGNDNLTEQLRAAPETDRQGVLNDWLARNPQSAATLQQRVDEAARRAGYNVGPVWHGSPDFIGNEFSLNLLGRRGLSRGGFSFTPDRASAEAYMQSGVDPAQRLVDEANALMRELQNRIDAGLVWEGPWERTEAPEFRSDAVDDISGFQDYLFELSETLPDDLAAGVLELSKRPSPENFVANPRLIRAFLKDPKTLQVAGKKLFLATDPSQIKSADPVTYDDNGNVIPLSQRFQPESPDIRFSLTEPAASNIIQDANQTTDEQQPTRSRPLSPETAPGRATEVLPTGEEIVERTQIDKTSMPRLEALAIKFVDSLGPVDTWPNKILNPAWWKANGGNMRDEFGRMVMAEALYRTSIGALQGNPTLVEVNDLISREYQIGATSAAKALAAQSYITTSERYGPMFAVQGMVDQRRRQQETVIDANVDVAAGVDAVNNADAQAQSDASAELDEELRLKDAIYELGLAARTPEIQTRIRRINDNVFRLGVLAQIREQLLSRVQASFVGLSRAAVEQQYASLSVEQIDAEIARLEREVADDVAAVEGERQRVRAAPKPKGAAADPITQARTIIARLEADPKTKKTPKANPVRDLYREHLKNPMAEDEFVTRMAGIGVPAAEAQKLYDLAAVKIAATEAVKAQREAAGEVKKLSDAERFAERVINDAAERFADPALPIEENERKVLPIRDLFNFHVQNGMTLEAFIPAAAQAGLDEATARRLHGAGLLVRDARQSIKTARTEARLDDMAASEAGRLIYETSKLHRQSGYINTASPAAESIRGIFIEQVKSPQPFEQFAERLKALRVDEDLAARLFNVANRETAARQAMAEERQRQANIRREIKLDEMAAKEAGRLIYETSKLHRQSGYINTASPAADTIRKAFTDQVKEPKSFEQFVERLKTLRVEEDLATRLFNVADREHTARKAVALERKRQREAKEDSPAVAFAKRTIDDVASRLADPALPQEERQRKVLAIRELYKEHVRDGLPFDVFISRAEAAGVEGAMASTLHGVGMMEREARETTRGYNEAQAGQRFAEKTINDAATLYADPALPQPVRNKRRVAAQELYNKHVKKAMDQAEFLEAARKAGVNEATAMVLFNVGNMTREAREAQAYGRRLIERRERLLDAEGSTLENLINKLRGKITGDLSWREMFDRPLETQRQWRRDLFAALRNDPALAGLTPQEIGDLVVEIDKVWEAKRKKNFEAQLKRMNLPGAKGNSKDKIVKSAPKLLRYINAGFFNDDAFRNAISEEFGIPALNEETVKQVVDLMQRAQADGITEVERKGLMIEAIRLMQRDLKAELGDILSNYWVTSVLSGFATQFDMAFSALNGMRVMAQSMADLAIRKREFKLAGRAGMAYLRALGNVILEAARYFYTGDPKLLDNYQYTLNTYLTEGSAAANPFDYFERIIKDPNRPSWAKIMPYFYAGMQRAMTAFDHINSTATTQGMLEMAMFYNRELYDKARMPSKEDVAAARAKAVEMAGGDKTWGQKREVSSYTRQILNELLNKTYPGLLDEARDIGKVVSYTNDPTGIGGIVYHTLLGVTNKYINEAGKYRDEVRAQQEAASRTKRFMANLNYIAAANARNLTGLRFVRFVGNRLNEILSFTPGLGLLRLQEKGMTPTMRAMIIQNQTVGLSLSVLAGVTILRALTDEEDDEKRGFRISGSWSSLPPDKKNQLRASGRSPYAIELWDGKKWTSFNYNAWPVASIIATAGNLNDQRLFNPEKWEEKDLEDKLLSAAWAGAFSFKDLSALSGFMDMIGKSAYSSDPVEGATQWISKFSSNYVGGFIPRMLKDIDLIMDPETRKARDFGAYFAKELPFFRRTEVAGEKLYNIFGEPVKLNRMPWRRAVTATREEPEYETLAELNRRGIFLGAANPSNRTVGSGANRRELTDAEAEKYMVETGKLYRDFIKQQGQSLLQLDRTQAEEVISKTTERLRAAALRMSIGATK